MPVGSAVPLGIALPKAAASPRDRDLNPGGENAVRVAATQPLPRANASNSFPELVAQVGGRHPLPMTQVTLAPTPSGPERTSPRAALLLRHVLLHDDPMLASEPSGEATSHFPRALAERAGARGSDPSSPHPFLALFVKVVFNSISWYKFCTRNWM